jgi:hypothetical protein
VEFFVPNETNKWHIEEKEGRVEGAGEQAVDGEQHIQFARHEGTHQAAIQRGEGKGHGTGDMQAIDQMQTRYEQVGNIYNIK